MSLGRLARTVRRLDVRQVVGRVGFRARRAAWPFVRALPPLGARVPLLPRRDRLPATTPLDSDDLEALARGRLRLAGHEGRLPAEAPFESDERDPLFCYQLHEQGWLREAMSRAPELRAPLSAWLDRYVRTHFPRGSVALDPYPLATRVREWQGLVQLGLRAPGSIAPAMSEAARLLAGLSETHLLANHLLRDRAAMVVASAWVDGATGAWMRGTYARLFAAECRAQFDPEGMHEERCPAYHAQAVMDLLFALEAMGAAGDVARGRAARAREEVRDLAALALGALAVVTHADDGVAAVGDSAPGSTPSGSSIAAWAAELGITPRGPSTIRSGRLERRTLAASGFSRLRVGELECFVSHGPFGSATQPGHAHCDLLGIELDVRGERVVVDPGVHAYHDPIWRERTRASRSHATPSVPGLEQAEIWSRFRCGWRPSAPEVVWSEAGLRGRVTAFGPSAARVLAREIRVGAGALTLIDQVEGGGPVEAALPLAPSLQVRRIDPRALLVTRAGEPVLSVRVAAPGALAIEAGEVSHRFGARAPAALVRLRGTGRVEYTLALATP